MIFTMRSKVWPIGRNSFAPTARGRRQSISGRSAGVRRHMTSERRSLRRFRARLALGVAAGEHRRQEPPGVAALRLDDVLGRAGRHDLAAAVATLGAKVDDPIGGLDHLEIVLDY